jgi:inosine-uridine nucleoside N-ribohydrolase
VLATAEVMQQVRAMDTPFAIRVAKLLQFFAGTYKEVFKFEHPPVHDPVAVAYLIAPEAFKTELMRVDIETCSALSAGQTVVDSWHVSTKRKNVTVCLSVDVTRMWDLMLEAIAQCSKRSTLQAP